jgi:hypothetical protein
VKRLFCIGRTTRGRGGRVDINGGSISAASTGSEAVGCIGGGQFLQAHDFDARLSRIMSCIRWGLSGSRTLATPIIKSLAVFFCLFTAAFDVPPPVGKVTQCDLAIAFAKSDRPSLVDVAILRISGRISFATSFFGSNRKLRLIRATVLLGRWPLLGALCCGGLNRSALFEGSEVNKLVACRILLRSFPESEASAEIIEMLDF